MAYVAYQLDFLIAYNNTGSKLLQIWLSNFVIHSVSNTSEIFRLVLSYKSSINVSVNVTVSSTRKQLNHAVTLHNCQSTCFRHLVEFGELMLAGAVAINITFRESHGDLVFEKVSFVPREFYHPVILGNGSMANFLANCSVFNNGAAKGDTSVTYCRSKVFSITMAYFQTAFGEYARRLYFIKFALLAKAFQPTMLVVYKYYQYKDKPIRHSATIFAKGLSAHTLLNDK